MADNPLFYRSVVPLNKERHRGLRLETGPTRFGFAAQAHLIPAVIDEFEAAARHLPILFVPGPQQPTAIFLLGSRPGENRFVAADGHWTGGYVPAYLRRYPFIIGDVADADPLVCIDEESPLFGGSEPLFAASDEHTPMLSGTIRLLTDYREASTRTDSFVAALVRFDLLRTITIDVRVGEQDSRTMHGLMIVDAEKLATLPDADFLSLRRDGVLPAIYAHLSSLSGLESLGRAGDTPPQTREHSLSSPAEPARSKSTADADS